MTITRTGFIARTTVGKGEKRIPVASITAIQWKPVGAMVNGFIQFTIGGGNEAQSQFGHQTMSAVKDENSVVFLKKQMPAFQALREQIEGVIAQRGRPASMMAAVASGPLDQLKQLSELRDAGILTEEEFAAKKGVDLGSDVDRLTTTEQRPSPVGSGALFAVPTSMPVMAQTTRRVTYRGNPAFASMLAQMLEQEGATVKWERPDEQRGIAEIGQGVVVAMVVRGTDLAIKVAVDKFRKHMHGMGAEVTIEDDEQDDDLGD